MANIGVSFKLVEKDSLTLYKLIPCPYCSCPNAPYFPLTYESRYCYECDKSFTKRLVIEKYYQENQDKRPSLSLTNQQSEKETEEMIVSPKIVNLKNPEISTQTEQSVKTDKLIQTNESTHPASWEKTSSKEQVVFKNKPIHKDIQYTHLEKIIKDGLAIRRVDPLKFKDRKTDETLIFLFIKNGNTKNVMELIRKYKDLININHQSKQGRTPLMAAAHYEQLDVVSLLLDHNVDINIKDRQGNTVLHQILWKQNLKLLEKCFHQSFDINAKNNKGETCLIIASKLGFFEGVKFFVDKKADLSIKDTNGKTALDNANEKGHLQIIGFLKANGAEDVKEAEPKESAGWFT